MCKNPLIIFFKDNMENSTPPKTELSYRFPGQRPNEDIKFILRRHKVTMIVPLVYLFILAFLPLAFYALLIPYTFSAFMRAPYQDIYFLFITIYYGFLWIIAFTEWIDYYLDIWIITNQRIMDVQQRGLFHRVVAELDLKRIQDIISTVNGPLQTFFQYGDIQIQTASEENIIRPKAIPHPVTVRRKIMDLCRAAQETSGWGVAK